MATPGSSSPLSNNLPTNKNVIEGEFFQNMSNTLELMLKANENMLGQILDVLKGSTIAQEGGIDRNSKFWATYKKVSTEYDNDFLERANDDMAIILTFSGLLSAVISTFIVGMQPNPGDTTNDLLLYLIQITVNGTNSVSDINTLSSSTGFSTSTAWMQTFAYASLGFSVLAAFGAVMGKQWLNSYKSVEGRSLEERGIERQIKLDEVKKFHLQAILRTFLVLLQISLLFFGLSLSANMWAKQTTILSVIIATTASGILCYAGTMLMSALCPDSPFQTPGSKLLAAISQKFYPQKSTLTRQFAKSSAVRWILETSTNPEIVEAAAIMIPVVQWTPKFNASAAFARLRDNFMAFRDSEEFVKYGKIMANLCIQPMEIDSDLLLFPRNMYRKFVETWSHSMRKAFFDARDAYFQLKKTQEREHRATARSALRTVLVYGLAQEDRLSRPDNEDLIWTGDLQWRNKYYGYTPSRSEFDWLIDYLADEVKFHEDEDEETEGDALLALSAMHGLECSRVKRRSYISSLVHCMGPTRPHRVRHAALRAVFEAREELASITSALTSTGVDAQLLNDLSCALLTAVCPNDGQATHKTGPDAFFHVARDTLYIRILYTLTKNSEWCQRLRDGHLKRCISLVDRYRHFRPSDATSCYFLVVFERIKPLDMDLPFNPVEKKWRPLIEDAWNPVKNSMADLIDGIPALVRATRPILTASDEDVPKQWFADLAANVHRTLGNLQQTKAEYVKGGTARVTAFDTAVSSIKGLEVELNGIQVIEQRSRSKKNSRSLGS